MDTTPHRGHPFLTPLTSHVQDHVKWLILYVMFFAQMQDVFVSRLSVRRLQVPVVSCHCLVTSTRPLSVQDQHFQVFLHFRVRQREFLPRPCQERNHHNAPLRTRMCCVAETVHNKGYEPKSWRRCRDNAHRSVLHRMTVNPVHNSTRTLAVSEDSDHCCNSFSIFEILVYSQASGNWCEKMCSVRVRKLQETRARRQFCHNG